ncbi:MAG: hypothetical protein ACR2OV_04570 [Hyphomicrobiaceae bacterium]
MRLTHSHRGAVVFGRLILILLQLAVGWFAAPHIKQYVPSLGQLDIFVLAAIFALVVWLVGFIGALALKDVGQPTPSTLMVALVCAAIFAGMTLVPDVMRAINGLVRIPVSAYPLIGAVVGYAIKR